MTQGYFQKASVALMAAAISLVPLAAWPYVHHTNRTVTVVHSPDQRECTFFILSGISESDPVTPGNPWFAVSKNHSGYKEIVATLLMARATGAPLQHVTTTGAAVCGHAEVASLSI
jgi:hypothetical protein